MLRLIHGAKVLHRDLRLENLLVQDSGDVAIIDFDQAVLAAEDGLDQEDEMLRFLLEDLVGDHIEATGTSGVHGARGNAIQVAETAETPGIRRRGKAQEVFEEKAKTMTSRDKGKTRTVAAVDAAPKHDVQSTAAARTKENVVEMDPKHQVTADVTIVTGSEIRAIQAAHKPRMSGGMVLRPKPPKVSR